MTEQETRNFVFKKIAEASEPIIQQHIADYQMRLRDHGETDAKISELVLEYADETLCWMQRAANEVAREVMERTQR
ncbi:hypothetical protein [Hyphococcus sp.]|uniref:hypothetical protein n=1 Tax=Hyphococcus sp. TaxID=2038636 RepID=UPI003CCBD701